MRADWVVVDMSEIQPGTDWGGKLDAVQRALRAGLEESERIAREHRIDADDSEEVRRIRALEAAVGRGAIIGGWI